jgi:hypothetical protein
MSMLGSKMTDRWPIRLIDDHRICVRLGKNNAALLRPPLILFGVFFDQQSHRTGPVRTRAQGNMPAFCSLAREASFVELHRAAGIRPIS